MSWSIAKHGTGAEVGPAVKKAFGAVAGDVPPVLNLLAETFAAKYPDQRITFESSGHLDQHYGTLEVKARVWPPL